MARIPVIEYEEANGRLLDIYNAIISSRGKLAEIHKIQSLRPESIVKHMDLYMEIMFSRSDLSRADREMMAVIVSQANQCKYCVSHHSQALIHYWKKQDKIVALLSDFNETDLNSRQKALCRFARQLTLQPGNFEDEYETQLLREVGLSDQALLDASLVVAYFNFVNRIVLSLGVKMTEEEVSGYKY